MKPVKDGDKKFIINKKNVIEQQVKFNNALIDEDIDPYSDMMEFIKQFGCIVMFGQIFPLAGLCCLITNYALLGIVGSEMWCTRRTIPKLAMGIGQFEYMIRFLSHLSVVINVSIMFFVSEKLKEAIVSAPEDTQLVCLGRPEDGFCTKVPLNNKLLSVGVNYSLVLTAVEHLIFLIKVLYQKFVDSSNCYPEEDRINLMLRNGYYKKAQIVKKLHEGQAETETIFDKADSDIKKKSKR